MKCDYESDLYVNEVQCFYDWLETNQLGTSCIVLWHALMHTYRKAGYPERFAVAKSTLAGKTGLSESTIKKARNELKQFGRIEWFERKGKQSAVYKMILFDVAAFCEPQPKPQPEPQPKPQPEPQPKPQNSFKPYGASFKSIQAHYEQHMGNLLSPSAYTKILEFLEAGVEEALICAAIDKSIDSGARNWVYAERMIDGCIVKEIRTLAQYELNEANRKATKARIGKGGGVMPGGGNSGYIKPEDKQGGGDPYKNVGSIKL